MALAERFSEAVGAHRGKLLNPEHRACRLAKQNRNRQHWPMPMAGIEEPKIRRQVRERAGRHVRWGRQLVNSRPRLEGWSVGHKRVGQRYQPAAGSRELWRADRSHHTLAIDLQCDQTMDGRTVRFLNVLDEDSPICLAIHFDQGYKAFNVIDTAKELLEL